MTFNFDVILLILALASGIIYAIDKIVFEQKRIASIKPQLKKIKKCKFRHKFIKTHNAQAPLLADYARSLFSVFLLVFIIRGFLLGNFFIPTASMSPTLPIGDFILVNKTAYGIRSPFSEKVISNSIGGTPQHGDIAVFKYPLRPEIDFVKRVIGVPGDIISYNNKELRVNGTSFEYTHCQYGVQTDYNGATDNSICLEDMFDTPHTIDWINDAQAENFKNMIVPEGSYFMMGDNRDNSEDSRYWGFVPYENFVGKAFFVWFSWDKNTKSIRWSEIGKTF